MLPVPKRVNGLDFLRGLASFAVCWFHLTYFTYPTADDGLYHLVRLSGKYGWLGVQVFFVISGFVIPYSLYNSGYRLKDFPTFLFKRIARLDPPYLVTILLTLFLGYAYALKSGHAPEVEGAPITAARVLLHFAYLNVFFGYVWLNPVFWTLAIEFQYYIMVGFAFPLIVTRNRHIRILGFVMLSALCFFGRYVLVARGVRYDAFILHFLFLFQMGITTFQYLSGIIKKREFLVFLPLAVVGCFITVGTSQTLAGVFAVVVTMAYNRRNVISDFFGRISYSLYLLHWPVGHLFLSLVGVKLFHAQSGIARLAVLLAAACVTVFAAYTLYVVIERPSQRWSHRIRYKKKRESGDQIKAPELSLDVGLTDPLLHLSRITKEPS